MKSVSKITTELKMVAMVAVTNGFVLLKTAGKSEEDVLGSIYETSWADGHILQNTIKFKLRMPRGTFEEDTYNNLKARVMEECKKLPGVISVNFDGHYNAVVVCFKTSKEEETARRAAAKAKQAALVAKFKEEHPEWADVDLSTRHRFDTAFGFVRAHYILSRDAQNQKFPGMAASYQERADKELEKAKAYIKKYTIQA